MRIESTIGRNNTAKTPNNKKKKKKEEKGKESFIESESIELSDELKLLNKLLSATRNKFIPYPFYFTKSAEKNIQQAQSIAKNIQNQAESMGIFYNYLMIYDMVIDLATKNHLNIQWTTHNSHELLNESEKQLFENLHLICLKNKTSTGIISSVVTKYIFEKQNNALSLSKKINSASLILGFLKNNPMIQNHHIKKELSTAIKHYLIQDKEPTLS